MLSKLFLFIISASLLDAKMCVAQRPPGTDSVVNWELALPGLQYQFPADHAVHRNFKTEWWYFTGSLQSMEGHAYGYELTFFRQGVIPPSQDANPLMASRDGSRSRFVQNDFKFAHFAITDLDGANFTFAQKISRGAFGEAGFGLPPPAATDHARTPIERLAWLENWTLQTQPDGDWHIAAQADTSPQMSIDLVVSPTKPLVIHGTEGVSQKAAGVGSASHYYSFTRMKTAGVLTLGDARVPQRVHGESWFDHEWASNQLAPDQVGWNWFCFQFDDQSELMLYAMRRRDGGIDPVSSGTLVYPNGDTEHLRRDQFQLHPRRSWRSQKTGALYPIEWQVQIPSRGMDLTVRARMDNQELVLPAISYWEGAIQASGKCAGREIKGVGYMELTGYASALKALQRQAEPEANLRAPVR